MRHGTEPVATPPSWRITLGWVTVAVMACSGSPAPSPSPQASAHVPRALPSAPTTPGTALASTSPSPSTSQSPSPPTATSPSLGILGWEQDVGFALGAKNGEAHVFEVRCNTTTKAIEAGRAFLGGNVSQFSDVARTPDHLVTFAGKGALLHARDGSGFEKIPGKRAFFSPDGTRVVTVDDANVFAIDVATGSITSTTPFPFSIPTEFREGFLLDQGRVFAYVDDSERDMRYVVLVDVVAGKVLLARNVHAAVLSKSTRLLATLEPEQKPGYAFPHLILRVWDRRALGKPRRADVGGGWTQGAGYGVQFDRKEKNAIVFEHGIRSNPRVLKHRFNIVSSRLGKPPASGTLPAAGLVERWEQIAPRWKHLAKSPQQLVPTTAGPSRPLAFAENDSRTSVALLVGEVTPWMYGAHVTSPTLLLVDAAKKRVRHRVVFPFAPSTKLSNINMRMSPNGKGIWACLGPLDGKSTLFAIDPGTGKAHDAGEHECWDNWKFSDDGTTVFNAELAISVKTGTVFTQTAP